MNTQERVDRAIAICEAQIQGYNEAGEHGTKARIKAESELVAFLRVRSWIWNDNRLESKIECVDSVTSRQVIEGGV